MHVYQIKLDKQWANASSIVIILLCLTLALWALLIAVIVIATIFLQVFSLVTPVSRYFRWYVLSPHGQRSHYAMLPSLAALYPYRLIKPCPSLYMKAEKAHALLSYSGKPLCLLCQSLPIKNPSRRNIKVGENDCCHRFVECQTGSVSSLDESRLN